MFGRHLRISSGGMPLLHAGVLRERVCARMRWGETCLHRPARNGVDEVGAGFFDARGGSLFRRFCGGLFRAAFFPEGFCFRVASLSLDVSFKLKSSPPKSTQVRLRRTRCTACGTCTTGIAFNGGSEFRLLASVGAGDIFSPECRNCPFAQDTLYCLHRLYDGGCV